MTTTNQILKVVAERCLATLINDEIVWPNGDKVELELIKKQDHILIWRINATPKGKGYGRRTIEA